MPLLAPLMLLNLGLVVLGTWLFPLNPPHVTSNSISGNWAGNTVQSPRFFIDT